MRTKYFAHDQSKEKCNKKNIKKHIYTRHKYTSTYAPMVFEKQRKGILAPTSFRVAYRWNKQNFKGLLYHNKPLEILNICLSHVAETLILKHITLSRLRIYDGDFNYRYRGHSISIMQGFTIILKAQQQ